MDGTNFSEYFSRLPIKRRRLIQTAMASSAGAAFLAACGGSSPTTTTNNTTAGGNGGGGNYPSHKKWNFVFVNHVTTNPFFVPTIYGIQDACALVNCTYQWTGSTNSIASEMVNAMNTAIAAKADGIAVAIVDKTAFDAPVENALNAGIPVVSYNADAPVGSANKRLAYIGQDLYQSGVALGNRIVSLVPSGNIAGFIATPGQLNIQPRIDGAKAAIQASGKPINFTQIATGAQLPDELTHIEAYYLGHQNVNGMVAVDAGSTQGLSEIMQKYNLPAKGIHAGGFDLQPKTLQEIQAGNLDFTIDQQPYLQGFIPVMQLFLYKLSGGLMFPAETDTGLLFVTKDNVGPYLSTQSRFEGSTSAQKNLAPS